MDDLGHWILSHGCTFNSNSFGFIYEIKNNVSGRIYIGKKQCLKRVKKKPLKGKKRNRIEKKESDWKYYTGSSNELNDDIKTLGKEKFTFTILKECGSKWELGYEEIKEQLNREVLLSDRYYNGVMNVRIGRPPKLLEKK